MTLILGILVGIEIRLLLERYLQHRLDRRVLRQRAESIAADWQAHVAEHPSADPESVTVELPLSWRPT